MLPLLIAGLMKAQQPNHAQCRAQDLVESDGATMVVQCSCNVRLDLTLPRVVPAEEPKPKAGKAVPDGA